MKTTIAHDSWVAFRKPNPDARLRLFCFPYAGAGAAIFRTWTGTLPTYVEVCPIQLPGRATRLMEAPFTQLSPLVHALAEALEPLLDRPFAFFGHSLGALVGFELARLMRRRCHTQPIRLFVSAARAPQIRDQSPPTYALSDGEFLGELRRLNGTPEELLENVELMQIILRVLRADFSVSETYVYQPESPLDCSIVSFGGLQDRRVSRDDLEGWRDQTNASFSLRMFPGDHFFLNATQQLLLQMLSHELGGGV